MAEFEIDKSKMSPLTRIPSPLSTHDFRTMAQVALGDPPHPITLDMFLKDAEKQKNKKDRSTLQNSNDDDE